MNLTNGNYEKLVEQITDLVLAKIGNDDYCPSFCRAATSGYKTGSSVFST